MKNLLIAVISLFIYFQSHSQNVKRITSLITPANTSGVWTTDAEPIPFENTRVLSYNYMTSNSSFVSVGMVKLDAADNVVFSRTFSINQRHLYCQKVIYANNVLNALFVHRSSSNTDLNYTTVVARINAADGTLISADTYDGYYANSNHMAVNMEVNGPTTGILSYTYDNTNYPNINARAYFILSNTAQSPMHTKAFELHDPAHPASIFYPANMGICQYIYNPNQGYPNTTLNYDFCGIYEDFNDPDSRSGFHIYRQGSSPNPSGYSDVKYTFRLDNKNMQYVNMAYWDGIAFHWGQNVSPGGGLGFGDVFYSRMLWGNYAQMIPTYYNYAFEYMPSVKGTYNSPDNFFPFCGAYEPTNTSEAGYIYGKFGLGTNPEAMVENRKYRLNVDYYNPNIHPGADKGPYTNPAISGIANRIGGTDYRRFYYWYDQDANCGPSITFTQADKRMVSIDEPGFTINETMLTVSTAPLISSNGPGHFIENICIDTYRTQQGEGGITADTKGEYLAALLIPELPLNPRAKRKPGSLAAKTVQPASRLSATTSKPGFSISVYPNPASDICTINARGALISSIEVLNTNGSRILTRERLNTPNERLLTREWPAGVYTVKCTTSKGTASSKLIIQ
jgi:Secretion system C-terminal sorting domain